MCLRGPHARRIARRRRMHNAAGNLFAGIIWSKQCMHHLVSSCPNRPGKSTRRRTYQLVMGTFELKITYNTIIQITCIIRGSSLYRNKNNRKLERTDVAQKTSI